jgi:aldehyde:ferredoxin oxidoreductase
VEVVFLSPIRKGKMSGGYMGKILSVDLSTGEIKVETLQEKLRDDFIGGYGIGARILYSRQKVGVAPLGPENTLGMITGPLTGTLEPTASRFAVVGKSPRTGG